jgi:hypothetical protein
MFFSHFPQNERIFLKYVKKTNVAYFSRALEFFLNFSRALEFVVHIFEIHKNPITELNEPSPILLAVF